MESTDRHMPALMSVTEVAAALGITRQAVLLRAGAGQLLGAKVGNTWVFRAAVVERASASLAAPSVD